MYRALFFAICVCVAANPLPVQSQDLQPSQAQYQDAKMREERNRLGAAAEKTRADGDLPEAAQFAEEMFQVEKVWLGEQDEKLIASLNWLLNSLCRQWLTFDHR